MTRTEKYKELRKSLKKKYILVSWKEYISLYNLVERLNDELEQYKAIVNGHDKTMIDSVNELQNIINQSKEVKVCE